jgi:hypothetical protein
VSPTVATLLETILTPRSRTHSARKHKHSKPPAPACCARLYSDGVLSYMRVTLLLSPSAHFTFHDNHFSISPADALGTGTSSPPTGCATAMFSAICQTATFS